MEPEGIRTFLREYKLATGAGDVTKLGRIPDRMAHSGRFLVKLRSQSEAYRLVRDLHMTYYDVAKDGGKFLLQARIVY